MFDMMDDGMSVCVPDDPNGNAKLMFSILECLDKASRVSVVLSCFYYPWPRTINVDICLFWTEPGHLCNGSHQAGARQCRAQQDDLAGVGNLFRATVFVSL